MTFPTCPIHFSKLRFLNLMVELNVPFKSKSESWIQFLIQIHQSKYLK